MPGVLPVLLEKFRPGQPLLRKKEKLQERVDKSMDEDSWENC